jgi:hypothetical protein
MLSQQTLSLLLAIGVPYLTSMIKDLWMVFSEKIPAPIAALKPILAGMLISYVAKHFGVALPTDFSALSPNDTMNVVTSGAFLGSIGHWLSGMAAALRSHFSADTKIGKIISAVLGK